MTALSVLVVDDAIFIRDLIKRSLRESFPSFKVEDTINGKKAIQMMKKHPFDLILCDWEMPENSGIEVLTWLREYEAENNLEKTPFIMITSRGDKNYVIEAVQSGVSEYIGKPFTGEKLIEKITKVLLPKHPEFRLPKSENNTNLLTPAVAPTPPKKSKTTVKKPKKKTPSLRPKGNAFLRTNTTTYNGLIRGIDLKEILLQISRHDSLPSLFDTVVVEISNPDNPETVTSLNACIVHTASLDGSASATSLTCKASWTDDDPKKMASLSKIIEQIQ